jgi:hypothetical protein
MRKLKQGTGSLKSQRYSVCIHALVLDDGLMPVCFA